MGPNEKKLRELAASTLTELDDAIDEWDAGATSLTEVATGLRTQAGKLRESYGNAKGTGTGDQAAEAYERLAKAVMVREDEMRNVIKGLEASRRVVTVSAPAEQDKLPGVSSPPGSELANPRFQKVYEKQAEDYQKSKDAREAAAAAALTRLDTEFEEAAKKMGQPLPDKNTYTTQPTGTGTSVTSGGQTQPVTPHLIGQAQDDTPHVQFVVSKPPPGDQSGGPLTGTGEVGDPGTDGDLSGGPVIQPGDPTVTGGTPATSAGGAVGSGAAAGAGMAALGGAGAVAGTRGAGSVRGASVKAGKTAALGRSSAAVSQGALGKSGSAGAQGNTGGARRGSAGAGRAGGRGTGAGAGAGQTGRTGGRGGAGGRGSAGRSTAAGAGGTGRTSPQGKGTGASGRKTPLSAAATGGRKGKRDRDDDQARDGIVFADEQSWLDDEQTGDAVID